MVKRILVLLLASLAWLGCAGEPDGTDGGDDDAEVADDAEALKAESAIGGHAFGLGVDAPKAVTSPLWSTLVAKWRDGDASLRTARNVFYLADGMYDPAKLRAWVDGVKAGGLEPMVGVSVLRHNDKGDKIQPVSRATFRARFHDLLLAFPDVPYWGVVNEPDL